MLLLTIYFKDKFSVFYRTCIKTFPVLYLIVYQKKCGKTKINNQKNTQMLNDNSSEKREDSVTDEKIQSLHEMIATAEQTILSAKQMLSTMDAPVPKQTSVHIGESSKQIVHGAFDGQIMIGEDGKQYPVPANYASKSKLVEGDILKLTISPQGTFMYKQIGPIERKFLIGTVKQDERGNYIIKAEEKDFKVLLAAATYFKIEVEDEVTIVIPRDKEAVWSAIENVVRKASDPVTPRVVYEKKAIEEEESEEDESQLSAVEKLKQEIDEERKSHVTKDDLLDEWAPSADEIQEEAKQKVGAKKE